MDLYKWAFKLAPFTPSDLVADCFELASRIRVLDMRASPYDLTALGYSPICIETPEGRAEYESLQRDFARIAAPLRRRLQALCETIIESWTLLRSIGPLSTCLGHPMIVPATVRCWAEIDLSAIRHNAGVVRDKIGAKPGILAVVKANAYGHGSTQVAATLADLVELFGVANVEEAHPLAELQRDVLLLSPSAPGERAEVIARRYIATVSSAQEAANFPGGRVNLKIDTGMGRIGCPERYALGRTNRHSASEDS